ncbi:MAG: outer membrane lipoprotein-sorting protein [Akkermansia sp.]|nr:outer membrane lipoprotein-sorting protein [Akkermansia sp.]
MGLLKKFLCAAAVALAAGAGVYAQEEETPDADALLKAMREMTVSQGNKDVSGTIRKNKIKIPFSLSARGETIVFQYNEGDAWKRFDARIKEKNVDLMLVNEKGQARVMAAASYAQPIAGTDVCYEDLSLRFLYWKDGKVVTDGVDFRIKGRDCWVVQVANPTPSAGQFAWVRMWVDKENGTSWQIDGYGSDGKLKKRFSITSVQKLSDGTWFFKQMKVEVRNPQNPDKTIALDYLEMDDIKK